MLNITRNLQTEDWMTLKAGLESNSKELNNKIGLNLFIFEIMISATNRLNTEVQ